MVSCKFKGVVWGLILVARALWCLLVWLISISHPVEFTATNTVGSAVNSVVFLLAALSDGSLGAVTGTEVLGFLFFVSPFFGDLSGFWLAFGWL